MNKLSQFVKNRRKSLGLTQEDLSFKAGVGLRFVRDLEQGKKVYEWIRSIRYYHYLDMNLLP